MNPQEGKPADWHISIDELNPIFDTEGGTVTFTSKHFSESMRVGQTILIGSNTKRDQEGKAEVIEINQKLGTVKAKWLD